MSTASRFLASVGNGSSNSRSTRTTFFMTVLANRSFQGLAANRSSTNLLFWPYAVPSGPTARAKSSVVYPPPAPSSATRMRGVMAAKARSSAGRRPASSSRSFSLRFDASTAARSEGGTSTAVTCFAPGGGGRRTRDRRGGGGRRGLRTAASTRGSAGQREHQKWFHVRYCDKYRRHGDRATSSSRLYRGLPWLR